MKQNHIIVLVIVAVVTSLLIASGLSNNDFSVEILNANRSVDFKYAYENPGKEIALSGTFDSEHQVEYDPLVDAGITIFYLVDSSGDTSQVFFHGTEPQGLRQSETVMISSAEVINNEFHFILVDNGSIDKTSEIFNNIDLPNNIEFIKKKHNTGYGSGIKYGLKRVKTE